MEPTQGYQLTSARVWMWTSPPDPKPKKGTGVIGAFMGEDAQAPARGSILCKGTHPGDGRARVGSQVSSC